jgi:hypothetical protein
VADILGLVAGLLAFEKLAQSAKSRRG